MIFKGIRTSIAKKPYIFVIFQGGGGGSRPPVRPSGPVHALPIDAATSIFAGSKSQTFYLVSEVEQAGLNLTRHVRL